MAEGFGRWESDPLFPAAECVQDSADRMEAVYRLLLHVRKLVQGDMSDVKLVSAMQYERDVITALGTTKWQLEQFEREVNAAAFSDNSISRENAISKFRQFIRAIAEQISQVEESLESFKTDSNRTLKYSHSSEQDMDGLASFLSGGDNKDPHVYYSTDTDEIVELKLDSVPTANGYDSLKEYTACETGYSGNDMEAVPELHCSCGKNACGQDHNDNCMHSFDAGDSVGGSHCYSSKPSRQYRSFMRNLWFIKKGRESFTKRRKDGEVMDDLQNDSDGNMLPSFYLSSSGRVTSFWKGIFASSRSCRGSNIVDKITSLQSYYWPELIIRRLSRSGCFIYHNYPQIRLALAILIAVIVLSFLAFYVT